MYVPRPGKLTLIFFFFYNSSGRVSGELVVFSNFVNSKILANQPRIRTVITGVTKFSGKFTCNLSSVKPKLIVRFFTYEMSMNSVLSRERF